MLLNCSEENSVFIAAMNLKFQNFHISLSQYLSCYYIKSSILVENNNNITK